MEITRIFDIVRRYQTLFPQQDCVFAWKKHGQTQWNKMGVDEYAKAVDVMSCALLELGIQRGDKIGIVSPSRPEWNIVDYATMQIGAVSIPIYPTIGQEEYRHIFSNSEMKVLFVEVKELKTKMMPLFPELPCLQHIVTFDKHDDLPYQCYADLYQLGEQAYAKQMPQVERLRDSVKPTDLATLIYTSGTTGMPKGVMLSHRNIVMQVHGVAGIPDGTAKRTLSFLPLCHAYERMLVYYYQYAGLSTYYAENLGTIGADIQSADPNIMTCVPRVLEKVYDKLVLRGEKMSWPLRSLYFWAMRVAEQFSYEHSTAWYRLKYRIADRLIFGKWREAIGGHFEIVVSGGSALQPKLSAFFSAIGMPIIEGYGLSETSPVITVSRKGLHERRPGCVGVALPGVEVKIGENGEVLCRGNNVMMGYYKNPAQTAEVIDADGWFHTGDTGTLSPEGLLSINGRVKSIFKTSLGKYINPEVVETKCLESPFIESIIVLGEYKPCAAALISPDFNYVRTWAKQQGIDVKTNADIVGNRAINKQIEKEIKQLCRGFGDWEQIKRFRLVPDEWTDKNYLSPTLKVKRKVVMQAYKDEIEQLWQ